MWQLALIMYVLIVIQAVVVVSVLLQTVQVVQIIYISIKTINVLLTAQLDIIMIILQIQPAHVEIHAVHVIRQHVVHVLVLQLLSVIVALTIIIY